MPKDSVTVAFKEGQKSVLRALLEIADVGEIEEVRKAVCYYMQENNICLEPVEYKN